jgi:hypothetical protein
MAGKIALFAVEVAARNLTKAMTFRLRVSHCFGSAKLRDEHCSVDGV